MQFKSKCLKKITACLCSIVIAATAIPGLGGKSNKTPMTASAATTIANPFIWSDVPDCDVIKVGDTYYMVSTTMYFCPGVPIMKSKDMMSWEMCNYVYDTYADGQKQTLSAGQHDYAHGQWATSLRYDGTYFYVFFGSYGTGNSYIYKTTDIENGTWTRTEIRGMYHDASMLFDTDGKKYLVYGSGEIKIKEFNDDMTGFKAGGLDKTLFKTNYSGLSGEGSRALKIGDYYYVFIIAWPSGRRRIEIAYRAKSLYDNFETKEILDSGLGTYGSGVAQGTLIEGPNNQWYALLFQDHGSVGRVPVLVPAKWEDNWPVLGTAPVTLQAPDSYTGVTLARSDDFSYSENKLNLLWQWNHNPDNSAWSVTDRPGYLRLTNKTIANDILWARNTLTMRTEGPACSSYIKLDTSGMKAGDYAGLSAFQFNYGNVGAYVRDDGSRWVYMAKNGGSEIANSTDKIIEQVPMGDRKEVYLKVDFNFNTVDGNMNVSNNIDKANFFYSFDGNSWTKIGETLGMTYDLKLFTGYRSGIYSYPTKTTGGYADIDFFNYERSEWNVPEIIEPDENGYFFHTTYEDGTDGWTARGGATITVDGSESFEGSKSLYITDRTASWNGASKKISPNAFVPGQEYSFSANVMFNEGGATDDFFIKLQYVDSTGETNYSTIAEGTAKKGEWTQLANTNYKIPEDATDMYFYVETVESTNSFYVDEMIGAIGGTEIAGAAPSLKATPGDYDNDGIIDAFDVVLARQAYLAFKDGAAAPKAADVDNDGNFKINDLVLLSSFVLGEISEFPDRSDIA